MPVSIAEYLGQRTDMPTPIIRPARSGAICPFMDVKCGKIDQGYKPVCSVRKTDGTLWIVCRHRLCSTKKDLPTTQYQKDILLEIARTIFLPGINLNNIAIKKEVALPVSGRSSYHADYIMVLHNRRLSGASPTKVVLEMQGGGETSNTGKITRFIDAWENNRKRNNNLLSSPIQGVGTIETNAWRRQQEQFLVKGSIVTRTGGAMVLSVGAPIFDYLWQRLQHVHFQNLRKHNWSLAFIGFKENTSQQINPGPIPLSIDPERLLFTDYLTFVQALISQGRPHPKMFQGKFELLSGEFVE